MKCVHYEITWIRITWYDEYLEDWLNIVENQNIQSNLAEYFGKLFIFKVFCVVKCCNTMLKCTYLSGKNQKTAHFQSFTTCRKSDISCCDILMKLLSLCHKIKALDV